jgi:hypothetical protein
MYDTAFVIVLFSLSLIMLAADIAAWIGWRRIRRSTLQLREVVDKRLAKLVLHDEVHRG